MFLNTIPLQKAVTSKGTYTNYDKIDTAAFVTKNARGLEAFKIMTRQFIAVANHMDNKGTALGFVERSF